MGVAMQAVSEETAPMSNASPVGTDRFPEVSPLQRLRAFLRSPLQVAAFWAAVWLPLTYPLLMYGGLGSAELPLLGALVVCNACALVLGRGHRRERAGAT